MPFVAFIITEWQKNSAYMSLLSVEWSTVDHVQGPEGYSGPAMYNVQLKSFNISY